MNNTAEQSRAFEAFNARFLTVEEIAKSFIPPVQYFRLAETNHSVLFGPRGSGKTTLLKMLQLRALASWGSSEAVGVRRTLGFHAIFVGTDVLWGSQLESKCKDIKNDLTRSQIRRTAFRLHLCIALINAINEARDSAVSQCEDLNRFVFTLSAQQEAELAEALGAVWLVDLTVSSFLGLRVALRRQLSELGIIVERARHGQSLEDALWLAMDPVGTLVSGIDIVNAHIGQEDRRWGVLCDELEIAPEMIRRELFQVLRSSHQNVIFKFSLFPHTAEVAEETGVAGPSANNDFDPLTLSYPYRRSAFEFCEKLLQGMIQAACEKDVSDPVQVLGDGWFDGSGFGAGTRDRSAPYRPPQGAIYRRALKLRHSDKTFSAWLARRKFDLKKVDELPEDIKAQFRKAVPFIITRSEYIGPNRSLKSKKSLSLYAGAYSLFSISEGNPRVFINLMRPLVREFCETGGTVRITSQAASIQATIHRYKASLSALPSRGVGEVRSIVQLVNVIGTFLQVEQIRATFSPEPPSTITIDDKLPPEMLELVGKALNSGALVKMPQEAGDTGRDPNHTEELKGARLRLAYTLAPEYKLALVSTRPIALSTVLHAVRAAKERRPGLFQQYLLPFHPEEA